MVNFRDSYFQVDWDLTTKRLKGTFWGKQYDTGRGFAVTVINGGQVVTPSTEVLRLKWEKPDNTSGYVQATIINGKFVIENIDQMFTVAGSVRADLELSVGGEFVASITFYVSVEKAVAVDAIQSSSQFTALQEALADVGDMQAQVDAVIANATVDSEVILARISRDKLHDTLNDRLLYDFKYFERYFINTQVVPTSAMTPEEMTDITKNYVYQGATTGEFWNGSWYYWDSTIWKRGGIYRPVIDTEVRIARDSLTKGKIFSSLDARLEESETDFKNLQTLISNGMTKVKYPSPATTAATYYLANSNAVCQVKADVLIGYRFNKIVKSLDGGITWVDFSPTLPTMPVNGQYVNLMDDGHLLVFGLDTTTNDGVILRSSNTAFNATTTWIEIKRIVGKSFASGNPYGININGHIVLGTSYPSNSPVFLSTDYGQTFRDIFTKAITHTHTTYIDPYDKTIWVATGDGTIHRNLYYSKDWGDTWNSVWTEGTAPTQITSIISRPECVLFGTDVNNEYAVWRYNKKTQQISKVFYGGTTETSSVCSLGVMPYNQETNDGLITWLPFQAEDSTKRWRLIATPDGVNYYVIDEPADLTMDKNLVSVEGVYDNKLIVRVAGNVAQYILPEWKDQ